MTKITDEAVKAAVDKWRDHEFDGLRDFHRMRAALEAALPHLSQGVRPLEWKIASGRHEHAHSVLGSYFAYDDGSWSNLASHHMRRDGDIGSAKAAAQADYERRVLSALSPAPVGVTGEVAKNSWRSNDDIAIELMDAASDADAEGRVADARFMRIAASRLEALASQAPAPTLLDELSDEELFADRSNENPNVGKSTSCDSDDTQEGVSEAGEVLGWSWSWGPEGKRIYDAERPDERQFPDKYYDLTPLVRQSALTACQQEVERLQGMLSGTNKVITGMSRDFTAAHESAEARIAELVEALGPFAEVAGEWDGQPAALSIFLEWNDEPEAVPNVLVEDFRRARAVLEQGKVDAG